MLSKCIICLIVDRRELRYILGFRISIGSVVGGYGIVRFVCGVFRFISGIYLVLMEFSYYVGNYRGLRVKNYYWLIV